MSAQRTIEIVTPAAPGSLRGNRITAERWARLARELGHAACVTEAWSGEPCDVLIALHAVRSAPSVAAFRAEHPEQPLVVALTGTDLYGDLAADSDARRSLVAADRLIVLHPRGADDLDAALRQRVRPIVQSVELPAFLGDGPEPEGFQVCVLGHLRPVKDPFRAAEAARSLPATSRARIVHVGAALDEAMAAEARREAAENPRYVWLGELPHRDALAVLAHSAVHVLSSRAEGGANALCEAIAYGVPTLASRIPGSVGLLGPDYPALFEVGDTRALTALLERAESDPAFLADLREHTRALAPLVRPERERADLGALLDELTGAAG